MQIIEFILQVLLGITSLLLTLLILLHKGRGGGLSDMFGGGASGGSAWATPQVPSAPYRAWKAYSVQPSRMSR